MHSLAGAHPRGKGGGETDVVEEAPLKEKVDSSVEKMPHKKEAVAPRRRGR